MKAKSRVEKEFKGGEAKSRVMKEYDVFVEPLDRFYWIPQVIFDRITLFHC